MKRKEFRYLIPTLLFVIALVGTFIVFSSKPKSSYRLDKFSLSEISGIDTAEWNKVFCKYPLPCLVLQNKKTGSRKYVLNTADCGIIKHGYKNRIELFIVFNEHGKIENVILGENIETVSLINKMRQEGFFRQWENKSSFEHIKVEYVTGATRSCQAISESVFDLLKTLEQKNFFNKS